ncbi:MAG: 1-(5-phosphoribosyl)-5-[(5-phosphoribosylamino)methylideneamino]imidazole-4-carboxamide isomerase [Vicinamibacteria bacterium]|nr:1-(5-phosphoribosyl)-5-[(5-phosphoribosylamino)methylideneamino]imidazole-4-carboxamide isomerase [Vicinamibacteria bacterium]
MTFTILPALDVRRGAVVRLSQGDYGAETIYDSSPIDRACAYARDGAMWLHLVDLDAAREGGYTLIPLLKEIQRRAPLQVQTGGGVRSEADVEAILQAGADRVVVGTLAIREPVRVASWLKTFGADRITLALDTHRDERGLWRLPVQGWTEASARTLEDLLGRYADAGLRHVLCTDIARDGMLSGFNVDLYRGLAERFPQLGIQASGGVRDLDDIRAVKDAGAEGAILGRALLERRFELREALAC